MTALGRTWKLYKQSLTALSQDGEILIFPVLGGMCALLLAAAYFVPAYRDGSLLALSRRQAGWDVYGTLFVWYYLNNFLMIFFNAALIGCAGIRLDGGDPTVADGFRIAFGRTGRIAAWALVASTVGVVLHAFSDRRNRLLRLMGAALSVAWTLTTYLIVPVLVMEDRGVLESVGRSAELFRKQWGEQLIGSFGFGMLNALLWLPGLLLAMGLYRLDHAAALITFGVYVVFQTTISCAVGGVFRAALYRFAVSGEAPSRFTADALEPTLRMRGGPGDWSPRPY